MTIQIANIDSLKLVTLADLLSEDRIVPVDGDSGAWRNFLRPSLEKEGDNLDFYVSQELAERLPLRMQLFANRDEVLIPNMPVSVLVYRQSGFNANIAKYHNSGVELPFGFGFNNKRRAPAGNRGLYFPEAESGWTSDEQGQIEKMDVDFDNFGGLLHDTIATTVVQYSN